jgi:hypothetical protein
MDKPVIIEFPGFLRNKIVKKLTFTSEGLTIEKPLSFGPSIFIPAKDITSFRYGIKWLSGYAFTIGRQYVIELNSLNGEIMPIKLKSLYQIRRKKYGDIWAEIIEQLWASYFQKLYTDYCDLYHSNRKFELAGIEFHQSGIAFGNKSLLWDRIALSNYRTYFMIHDKDDLNKKHSISFMKDWNAYLLQKLLRQIVEEYKTNQIIKAN